MNQLRSLVDWRQRATAELFNGTYEHATASGTVGFVVPLAKYYFDTDIHERRCTCADYA
jgi:hypothetical protein